MALSSGGRLGAYEILGSLGSGGMGEVYRARDTRLQREVAVKTLPAGFAQDPDRLSRFQREAQLLASLNHPNIASIYGLEESEGIRFLVMELVEGETLAERLASGRQRTVGGGLRSVVSGQLSASPKGAASPIPIDEALTLAKQIADGLEAAHEKSIFHRDIKPANIKVTPEGKVKILDFGLAKAFVGDTPVADGQRFLMIQESGAQSAPRQLEVVQEWFSELSRLK